MGFDGLPWDLSVNGTLAAPAGSALHPSVTSFRLKKALTKSSHSGAQSLSFVIPGHAPFAREPGIHNPRSWLWIPGLRQEAHPGMTEVMRRAHTWLKKA
jgi:hypothetical protein